MKKKQETITFIEEGKLTKEECIAMMASAQSVADWNALRDIVKRDYELAEFPNQLNSLMGEIDGSGMIDRVLKANSVKEFSPVPDDMIFTKNMEIFQTTK